MVKKVAAINDLSGLGKCSLTVAIPVLSALGVQACPLPTAILSNQTGYPHFFIEDFTDKMPKLLQEWESLGFTFDGIYIGYISDEKQVSIIEDFIKLFKRENTVVLVDPIMADDGEIYPNFSHELIKRIIELTFAADIITPNLTECCLITGNDYNELMKHQNKNDFLEKVSDICKMLIKGSVRAAVITGIIYKAAEDKEVMLYNAIIENNNISFVKGPIVGGSYSGTGDILASVICGMIVRGKTITSAVELAVEFIGAAVKDTYACGTDRNGGVNFEKYLGMLTSIQ